MEFVLHIETATSLCGVALFRNGKLFTERLDTEGMNHAEKLHVFMKDVLKAADIRPHDLTAISVSEGPGSYTGLRIGVSAAKGMAFALNKPLVLCSTLAIMANGVKQQLNGESDPFLLSPMLDARRMEVYTAIYNQNLEVINPPSAVVVDDNWKQALPSGSPVYFFGNGMPKSKDVLQLSDARFIENILPLPMYAMDLISEKIRLRLFSDVAYAEPAYLKPYFFATPKRQKSL